PLVSFCTALAKVCSSSVHCGMPTLVKFAGVASLCTRAGGYWEALARAVDGDADAPAAPPQPTLADRDRAELLARYGQPVWLNPLSPGDAEWVREEAFARAAADAAHRRHLP